MMENLDDRMTEPHKADLFTGTSWTVVLAALNASPGSAVALEKLCQKYWYPVYTYVRRRGYGPHDAEDLTQGFFYELVTNKRLRAANPNKGLFRAYLLAGVNGYLANHWNFVHAVKRGGRNVILSMDAQTAEERYAIEPISTVTPEQLFEQRWAMTVLAQAHEALEKEYKSAGKEDLYNALKTFLTEPPGTNRYAVVASQLGMSENALAVTIHRLRKRFQVALREEIGQTVHSADEIELELKHIAALLSNR